MEKREQRIQFTLRIIIATSIFNDEAIQIIKLVIKACDYLDVNDFQFHVNYTINNERKILSKITGGLPRNFSIVRSGIDSLLDKAHILISGMSSVCLESIALGVLLS